MTNTPQQRRDQLIRDIVGAAAFAMNQGGRGVQGDLLVASLRTIGKPYTDDEVTASIEYLVGAGYLAEVPKTIMPGLKLWKLTKSGMDWAYAEGLA